MTEQLFEQILKEIDTSLAPQGFQKTKQHHQPQLFDTRYAVFEAPGHLVRVIWDGKQRMLILRIYAKRKWIMKLAKVLIGQNDTEKLIKEFTIPRDEMMALSDEQVIGKCVQTVRDFNP
ncbi:MULTISPECIES: hypothetical protein [Cohnella]|jgi:hypothetical protein|uniref:hypothetical protein n=1 Tax=Cohnella TaxID=329857 RepID=UPI00037DAAD2|nr:MULTISPECIES: hypothetical protein [Cohnella]REK67718.1 MAG: hypothetical protein C6P35_04420 [Cohnella sp.]